LRVKQLIEFLEELPQDARVFLDDEDYPEVDGCYVVDPKEFNGDEEDKPPVNAVLLEVTYPTEPE
jgi:hypothetical protein